jgi:hypothetical protein
MKKRAFRLNHEFRNHRIVMACGGLLIFAILFLGPFRKAHTGLDGTSIPTAAPSSGAALLEGPGVPWYIRSGQWRADVRSLVAALRYLTESDSVAQTNLVPAKAEKV